MSEVTLLQLLTFDTAPWHAASDRWQQLRRGVDDATNRLIAGTRDLAHAWPDGAGSTAAYEQAAVLRDAMDNTYSRAAFLGQMLDQHAYAMTALRQQAESMLIEARDAGYTVDVATMSITAPASAYMGGNLDRTGRETGAFLNDLRTVVEYAREQDDRTARFLAENMPSGQTGFAAATPAAIARAEELMRKFKDPAYQPTFAELDELRDLVALHSREPAFAYTVMNGLGPKGLLELSGTLATYQLDQPGRSADDPLFDPATAEIVRDLQNGLGVMLGTATTETGTTGGLRGEDYVRGRYELSGQWVTDLMTAGRSRMDIGDPASPMRYAEDVYGYQLLGPLLHNGAYDAGFLSTVGGDIVDFEMEQGKGSALWTESRGENLRLDWTQNYDDNRAPAGYDPVNSLMDALSRNGDGTRELFTGATEHPLDGPAGGRLPRLDYLLTDRDWEPVIEDTPGGPGWTAEALTHPDGYRNGALDKFGLALEHATTGTPGPDARRLFEAIIYETSADEQAKGFPNGATSGDTTPFRENNLIHPQLRDSMANITAAYIFDVNANISDSDYVTNDNIDVERTDLTRFLADLGKDQGARETITTAEAVYAATSYDHVLSGRQNPSDDLAGNLRAMEVVSHNYGSVVGALDFGAGEDVHAKVAEQDEKSNSELEKKFMAAGALVEGAAGAVTSKIPGGADLANSLIGDVLDNVEKEMKVDSSGRATHDVGEMLGKGRVDAVDITEMALYNSGKLEDLPENFYRDGHLKPVGSWTEQDHQLWQRFKSEVGHSTVGSVGAQAGDSYQDGFTWAQMTLEGTGSKGGVSE
jgi:hypothetical protein